MKENNPLSQGENACMGDDTCHFRIWKKEKGEKDVWGPRSRALAKTEIQEKKQK